jgi:hypothetical protein
MAARRASPGCSSVMIGPSSAVDKRTVPARSPPRGRFGAKEGKMSQNAAELISDDDLETLFDGSAAPPASSSGVVHVPVPTDPPAITADGEESPAPAPPPRPKISIQIGPKPAAAAATAAESESAPTGSEGPLWKRFGGRLQAGIRTAGSATYRGCDLTLTALHLPFRWLSPGARNIVGGVAIVTCITATSAMIMGPMLFPRFYANSFVPAPAGSLVRAAQADGECAEPAVSGAPHAEAAGRRGSEGPEAAAQTGTHSKSASRASAGH